jgi:signal transduction histidine kinase
MVLAPDAFVREILEALRDGVVLLRPDGSIWSCNAAFARLVGAAPEALRGEPMERFARLPAPAGPEPARDGAAELVPLAGAPIPAALCAAPLRDGAGRLLGSVVAVQDLRELEALRRSLATSGRLAAVGELAAGIAHEIANPISFVRTNLGQLLGHWQTLAEAAAKADAAPGVDALLEEGEELLGEAIEGAGRVAEVVRNVAAFAHAGRAESELADVNALLDAAVNVAVLSSSVAVERCYAPVPPVRCAPQQLKQVFLNLILNALEAVEGQGRIRLVTEAAPGCVLVRVEDDGRGIPEALLERIFDPFFTTRPAGQGLGLAHCHQIVRSHGGEIHVESHPGRGSGFRIRLPVA